MTFSDLHAINPYDGFDAGAYELRLNGWNSNEPIFKQLIEELQPELIIEVGTWLGASAIHMAENTYSDTQILCVDTWLGALEFWTDQHDPQRYGALRLRNGYPSVYYQFLANVVLCSRQHQIIPFPQTSLIAARWCMERGITAKLIYIDASHDRDDVIADLRAWRPMVARGGVLFGDDWSTHASVREAVSSFSQHTMIPFEVSGNKWIIRF